MCPQDSQVSVTFFLDKLVLKVEGQEPTEFSWDVIRQHTYRLLFSLKYTSDDDSEETIKFESPFSSFMDLCVSRVLEEREWIKKLQGDMEKKKSCWCEGGKGIARITLAFVL